MLNYYEVSFTLTYQGKIIHSDTAYKLEDESKISKDEYFNITWDNAQTIKDKYSIFTGFSIHQTAKGKTIKCYNMGKTIKEWKQTPCMELTVIYTKLNPSIDTILKWHNGEEAIKYLIERGITHI